MLNVAFAGLLIPPTAGLALGSASFVALLIITQFADQFRIKDTSQLINGVYNILQKILKYFNVTAISTFSFSASLPSNFL